MATGRHEHERDGEPDGALTASTATWPEALARWLDDGLEVPGTGARIGLDPILGLLVPGLGDTLTAAVALALVARGIREGVPRAVLARMVLNVAVDAVVGAVPVLGDAFDFAWKSNRKNVELLQRHRDPNEQTTRPTDWLVLTLAAVVLLAAVAVPIAAAVALGVWIAHEGIR